MWTLTNRTPYGAERTWVRDKQGVHHWVIAVRATFEIEKDGKLKLTDEQLPPAVAAEFNGEPGKSSLKYETDLCPMKPGTDFTIIGQAYAPKARPVDKVLVGFRVEQLRKLIHVFGQRTYFDGPVGIETSPAKQFTVQPIVYESAYGGSDLSDPDPQSQAVDRRNPVGRGFALNSKRLIGQPAHSIEYPQGEPSKVGPAGFGPIASYWLPRVQYAGTYDARWEKSKRPLLPDDYDERFTLSAPPDQRFPKYLHGGEPIELMNLTPEGTLRLTLPKIYLTFSTRFGSQREEHRSRMSSVILEPDEKRLSLIWQTTLKVPARKVEHLDETFIGEKPYLT